MSIEKAQELSETSELGPRGLKSDGGWLIAIIAACWSLFQLALPQFLLLNSSFVRSIHLAFALVLVYLSFPMFKSPRGPRLFWEKNKVPWLDYLLALLGACAALYLFWDFEGISIRQGNPSAVDIGMGVLLIVLLLEAARRALGLALPTIATVFIFYSFFSEWMPEIVSFKNASVTKLINKLTMSTEGIFGVPLDVSASTVFLFVLFGAMLERAGGGKYFIDLAFSLLGKYRGGPGKAAVLASGLTGMVSGSSIANTVTTGTFTIPLMKKAGYPAVKAGAIEVAASTNGQLMPPIMGAAAFIIAEYCNLSYFDVVRAAFLPAVISYVGLIYLVNLEARKLNLKKIPQSELPEFWKTFKGGIHFLIPLGFLIYQLVIERKSAQLSAYYAIISLALLVLVHELYKGIQEKRSVLSSLKICLSEWVEGLISGARSMMGIGVAVAAAGIIVGVVTLGLGGVVTEVIEILSAGNLILLLLITALVSLILGMGLPTTANYIVMATLTAPVIFKLGGDLGLEIPLIAAHLFVFYFGILADDTPPVGLSAYAAAAISKADPIKTGMQGFAYDIRTAILPFMFIFNTELLLVGVDSWWRIALIFVAGLCGIFAFASLVQNFLLGKTNWLDRILLLGVIALCFRPDMLEGLFHRSVSLGYGVGIFLFLMIWVLQRWRFGLQADTAGTQKL